MKEELIRLRSVMKEKHLDAWLQPCSDAHGSEYIGAYDQCVRFLSGFTGDSCTLLVTEDRAFLWTDGRYFVQADRELKDTGVALMKMGEPGVPTLVEFLEKEAKSGYVLGFFAPLMNARTGKLLCDRLEQKGAKVKTDEDIVDEVWTDRPLRSAESIRLLPASYAGETTARKLKRVRAEMKKNGCPVFLTTALDEAAWLLNLRGSDIECNPLFLSDLMITEKDCVLFTQTKAVNGRVKKYCETNGIFLNEYEDWLDAVKELRGQRILLDLSETDLATYHAAAGGNEIADAISPIAALKCIKNAAEIRHMQESHIRDGVYMSKYLYWLTGAIKEKQKLSETDAAEKLDTLRAGDSRFVSLSFPTISAYGANAAMCHYKAVKETAAEIKPRGLYLVDSGAHYLDGTTDVTRTYAMGKTTAEERRDYTLTVVGMLRLMHAVFPQGIRGINLDTFAREPLWKYGLDFNHGTGHGVGYVNTVHEMPVSVRMRPSADRKRDVPFVPGMVTSDEPGVYLEGRFGIRTENMIFCKEDEKRKGFLTFEPLTYVPLDPEPLDPSYMTNQDKEYFNDYQKQVYRKIGSFLTAEERKWLAEKTRKIS